MEKSIPMELIKIKKIVDDIQEFPAKIDSVELAKNARRSLKKYALLSQKIDRNILISAAHQKDLANIRTVEFKKIRRILKEKANSVLHAKNIKNFQSEKNKEKSVKKAAPKKAAPEKASKAADVKVTKEKDAKKTVKKSSVKSGKATVPKKGA